MSAEICKVVVEKIASEKIVTNQDALKFFTDIITDSIDMHH